jgi:hypothetical protein
MRKRLMGFFAAFAMMFTAVGVSVAPTEAQAQSYRGDRGVYRDRGRRYHAPRRSYRGYRSHRTYRGYRGYRNPRAYRGYRDYRGRRHYNAPRHYRRHR